MSRITAMTVGLVLILLGVQFCLVKSYYLSPKTTRMLAEHFANPNPNPVNNNTAGSGWNNQKWPFYNSGTSGSGAIPQSLGVLPAGLANYGQKRVPTPRWIRWPFLFLGAVFFLHGAALRSE